ncbi:hypothetical protein [Ferrovibrio sp.]|uniref:hypothetical protein n=1 Tax=Ferrovibrio sp. TaxID=1917215 RepID=UPI0025BFA9BB|nr:hypothetical protein [Ferrovibrio sp.]MBX3455723.1 hypothetical protein [Ferrovibrio sp.]
MQRIDHPSAAPNMFGEGKSGFLPKNPATNSQGTAIMDFWLNAVQEEVLNPIEFVGMTPDPDDRSQLRKAIQAMIAAQSRPYDLHFIAGFGPDGNGVDLAVQVIGRTIMPRDVRFTAVRSRITLAPTGAAVILDVEKNGASIFATRPQFEIGATALTPGVITGGHVDFNTNDLLTVKVTQIGSVVKGQGLCFALAGVAL